MNQNEFEQQVLTEMQERLPGLHFELKDVEKLQNSSYRGLAVRYEGSPVTALIDLAPFLARTEAGEDFREVMEDITAKAGDAFRTSSVIGLESFQDYKTIRERLFVQLVNADSSRPLLDQYPHRRIGDMAMIARIDFSERDGQEMSAAVTKGMLEGFGISQDTLLADAVASGMNRKPATLRTIIEELSAISGMPMDFGGSVPGFWVASTKEKINGAAVICYPGFLDEAAEKLGSDFFVIPSSIHEMLLLPDDGTIRADALTHIQHEVNENEVLPEEVLSRQIFYYDAAERKLELASEHEAREAGKNAAAPDLPDPDDLPWQDEDNLHEETIRVLLVEPGGYPREMKIRNDLGGLQEAVGGMIETVYPFEDEACIVCNDMGKVNGYPLNRALRDEEGGVVDIIAGSFIIAGLQGDGFRSLNDEQLARYEKQFHQPETFVRMGRGFMAIPIPDDSVRLRRNEKAEAARAGEQKAAGAGIKKKEAPERRKDKSWSER